MSNTTTMMTLPDTTTPSTADAAALYRMVVERTRSPQKRANLARIWNALETIRADAERRRGPGKYTVAEVRRRLESAGTPIGESTILNKGQGDDYQALIKAYQAQYAQTEPMDAPDDAWAWEISDPRLQARIRIVLQQNRALQKRLDIVRRDYQHLVREEPRPSLPAPSASGSNPTDFAPREVRAVRRFLDRVADYGWQIDEASGAIIDQHGLEIAEPGFVHALRRVTGT